MRNVSGEENKIAPIVGTVWVIAVIGAVICGILECFGVSTGAVGGIIGLITILPISLIILFFLLCYVVKKIFPEYDKNKVEKVSVWILLFLIVNYLFAIFN